jgi:hypothetical protein
MRLTAPIAACVLLTTAALAGDHSEQRLADEICELINAIVDTSRTMCTTAAAREGKGRQVSVVTVMPMMGTPRTRKYFLAATIGAVGKVTRDNEWFQCREVLFTDGEAVNRGVFYKIPCSTAKDFQRRVHDEDKPLEDELARAEASLQEVSVHKEPPKHGAH